MFVKYIFKKVQKDVLSGLLSESAIRSGPAAAAGRIDQSAILQLLTRAAKSLVSFGSSLFPAFLVFTVNSQDNCRNTQASCQLSILLQLKTKRHDFILLYKFLPDNYILPFYLQ